MNSIKTTSSAARSAAILKFEMNQLLDFIKHLKFDQISSDSYTFDKDSTIETCKAP